MAVVRGVPTRRGRHRWRPFLGASVAASLTVLALDSLALAASPPDESFAPSTAIRVDLDAPAPQHDRVPRPTVAVGFQCGSLSGAVTSTTASGTLGALAHGTIDLGSGCGFLAHLVPLDSRYGDLHVDLGAGGPGAFAFRGGFDIGTPFLSLGSPLAPSLALRAVLDFSYATRPSNGEADVSSGDATVTSAVTTTATFVGVAPGLAIEASYPITGELGLEARFGVAVELGDVGISTQYSSCPTCNSVGWGTGNGTLFTGLVGVRL